MALCKVTVCDITNFPQEETKPSNMKLKNSKWLNADFQAHIELLPIPLIKATSGKLEECNIIKIKMRRDPASATSETYELKFQTYENGKPEEFLEMMKDFKTNTDRTGTTSATGKFSSYLQCYAGNL